MSDARSKNRFIEEHGISAWWWEQANENLDKWGWQEPETLLLATQEELGELTRAYLEYEHERGKRTTVEEELDDLAALMFQLYWVLVEGMP